MSYNPRFDPKHFNIDWDTAQRIRRAREGRADWLEVLGKTLFILALVPVIGIGALALICLIQISLAS